MANVNITKRAIQTAFLEILSKKTLGKITVKDITDRCGINRNTFYYHYQDIPALLEEICQNQVEEIINDYPTLNSLEECLDAAMQSVLKNRRAIMHIYNSDNRSTYINSLWRICEATITTYFNTAFKDIPLTDEDKVKIISKLLPNQDSVYPALSSYCAGNTRVLTKLLVRAIRIAELNNIEVNEDVVQASISQIIM